MRITSHVKYPERAPKPEPAAVQRRRAKPTFRALGDMTPNERVALHNAFLAGVPTSKIIQDFWISNSTIQTLKCKLRQKGKLPRD